MSPGPASLITWHYLIPPLSLRHRGLDSGHVYSIQLFSFLWWREEGPGRGQQVAANRMSGLRHFPSSSVDSSEFVGQARHPLRVAPHAQNTDL